ncbi:uncharacterized protein N7446_012115 [Penicillium canescens]|uniref:uncharacterized protein n=1 Tax=Penicillium canescens TaxID=5083 RepID=UPI0026DED0AE|nr:uncharacterized protein N7446_012115 [Penicillium canescens]KAJ6047281.1 hypothetical protein N7446_012115 [Penicillium canescens]
MDSNKFEQIGLSSFYHAIPTLDNANDWSQWNQKVKEFLRISPVAKDETIPPLEEEGAQQWSHRQTFYSSMIAAKLTHNAAQRINAFEITRVQTLIKAVKDNFKPEGSGTYVNLQRRYMSLTRAKCGSAQALGAEIRKIHAEKLLLDPACVTSEIERTFFSSMPWVQNMKASVTISSDKWTLDENGNITKAAPTFDYIENKAIEEEHRKGQLSNQSADANALPAFTLSQSLGDKKVTPSSDGKTCRIEIINVPFCTFCRKPYHREPQCFKKNPNLRDQEKGEKNTQAKTQRCI